MNVKKSKKELAENQKAILKLLMEKKYRQNELQNKLGISSPGLLYHLNILEKKKLIIKKTIQQIGNARINEISINPLQLQRIRSNLNLQIKKSTLITGFGKLGEGYRLPDESVDLLKKHHYKIERIACFTSIDALKIREEKISEENLIKISKYYLYDHNEYRNLDSYLFSELDGILREELKDANLLIDITPLTKLFSLILLKKSNEYDLPCFYIGKESKGNNKLIWMSNIKIEGELK